MKIMWGRINRTIPATNREHVGVAFVAILFGVVVSLMVANLAGEVRVWAESSENIRHSRVGHLLVGVSLTIFSFLGYFASQNRPQHKIYFFNWPLALFVLDVLMVFVYYLVLEFTETAIGADAPTITDARPEAIFVAVAFLLYFLWDLVSWRICSDNKYQDVVNLDVDSAYGARRWTTLVFLGLFVLISVFVFKYNPNSECGVVIVDGILIVMLFLYRVAKPLFDSRISTR